MVPMANAFAIRWKLDRPYVEQDKPEDVHALVTVEPNPALLREGGPATVHLLLLVDVSGSMDFLVRHDPKAQAVGQKVTEGQKAQKVVSDVPSRREMACTVVQKLAERLGADDLLSIVGFDDNAHVLAQCLSPSNLDGLNKAIRKLTKVGGGGTSLVKGLEAIRQILLTSSDGGRVRKLVLLTDGEDQEPGQALQQAKMLGADLHLPIVAFGMGECKVAFLTDVAKTTLAGGFNHIRHETDAEQLFHQVLTGQRNVQATNVQLKLWLSPDVQVREYYRTRPEILFVGSLEPDAANVATLNVEQMERGKAYEFLFRFTLPRRGANQRLRIAKATLTYEVSGSAQQVETNIVVEYTADANRIAERSGDVRRVLGRAEVQRQVLFLQAKADALKHGTGTDRDKVIVANLLKALVAKFTEFGDQATANQYRAMEEDFQRKGVLSQEMLNRSLAASSRAEEAAVPQDIDF